MTFGFVSDEKKIRHYKLVILNGQSRRADYVGAYGIDNLRKRIMSDYMRNPKNRVEAYLLKEKVSPTYGVQYTETYVGVLFMGYNRRYYWNDLEHRVSPATGELRA